MSDREKPDQESGKTGDDSADTHPNNSKTGESSQNRSSAGQTNATSSLPSQMPDVNDDEAWDAYPSWIRRLRRENMTRRHENEEKDTKIGDLEKRLTELEGANLTDNQKEFLRLKNLAEKDVPKLEAENRRLQVELRASQLGVVDTEAVVALLNWERVNKGDNVDTLIKELLEAKPYLKKDDSKEEKKKDKKKPVSENGANDEADDEDNEGDDATQDDASAEQKKPKPSVASPGSSHRGKIYTQKQLAQLSEEEINKMFDEGDLAQALKEGRVRKE